MPCPNCGNATPGRFCPECGQRRGDRRVRLRRLLADAVEDQFALNGTLPRSLRVLFTRPGMLTSEYMNGRIARYVPPFRLYLLSSFLFFLVFSTLPGNTNFTRTDDEDEPAAAADSSASEPGGLRIIATNDSGTVVIDADSLRRDSAAAGAVADSIANMDGLEFLPPALRDRIAARFRRLAQLEEGELDAVIKREFSDRMPLAVFLLLPIYAGILSLLYIRRKRYYVEHFVFALHVHAFTFILLTIERVAELFAGWAEPVLFLWLMVYVFLAMKRVYGQSLLRTGGKYLVLGMVYAPLLFILMIGLLLYVMLTAPV